MSSVLYEQIKNRALASNKEITDLNYAEVWFDAAYSLLKEVKAEGLTNTVKELEEIICIQEKFLAFSTI